MGYVQNFSDNKARAKKSTYCSCTVSWTYCFADLFLLVTVVDEKNGRSLLAFHFMRMEERKEGMESGESMKKSSIYWFARSSARPPEEVPDILS